MLKIYVFCHRHVVSNSTLTACLLGLFFLLVVPGIAIGQDAGDGCGAVVDNGNTYDYRPDKFMPNGTFRSREQMLKLVEDAHFTPAVETLRRGQSGFRPAPDIVFTLIKIPNHHRALMAMAALGEKEKTSKPFESTYTIECWFRRAIVWRPDDNIVRMLFAQYLFKARRENEAEQQLNVAASQSSDNPFTQHNIGLIYFDNKNYAKALAHAHRAYSLGLGTPTLRDQLKGIGKWAEKSDALLIEPVKSGP